MKVTGIGGVFFKAKDPQALQAWYRDHLGIDVQVWGGAVFEHGRADRATTTAATAWRIAPLDDESFAPSSAPFMINYLVDDLTGLLVKLRADGCDVVGEFDEAEQGKFAWVIDPEGNKIELWQPKE